MSDLFISSNLRPQVGPQRVQQTGRQLMCPQPDQNEPKDQIVKCMEKWNEKCREKLFQEKLDDNKPHCEKLGDKRFGEKIGDKCHSEKHGDKHHGEKIGDKFHSEKHCDKHHGEKHGDIKQHREKHDDKIGDKCHGEKLGDKFHQEKFGDKGSYPEKLGDKGSSEKLGDKGMKEKFGDKGSFPEKLDDIKSWGEKNGEKRECEKGCAEKSYEVLSPGATDPTGVIPSDRFFVKRG